MHTCLHINAPLRVGKQTVKRARIFGVHLHNSSSPKKVPRRRKLVPAGFGSIQKNLYNWDQVYIHKCRTSIILRLSPMFIPPANGLSQMIKFILDKDEFRVTGFYFRESLYYAIPQPLILLVVNRAATAGLCHETQNASSQNNCEKLCALMCFHTRSTNVISCGWFTNKAFKYSI